ncbi:peptidase U62 [Paractinoplanes abujensis]|uniref:Putative Zn-dependent protease n=1 Tax=Paractinoplanes abujensis TaxID=882441 RepID=A0A7W7G7C5_9ACTN|nr:metallopeptidase TldD-related protein [Actinoplanes abujensis]MBB4696851.1 putative Zn-dependent protease [Actinoplanes abujensis]GID18682.1 peptidase U62 [Actinoplanes abujensis]
MSIDIIRTGAELELAARVVELVRQVAGPGAEAEVMVRHDAEALTRFANSMIHQNVADAATNVRLRLHLDGRTAAGATTLVDTDGLRGLVERTVAAARLSPPDATWPGLTSPTPLHRSSGHHGSGERSGLDFGFDEATARADPAERAGRVRDFVRAAGGLETAGYCRTTYSSAAFANSAGQSVEGRTAEAAMDGIARAGGADGVARLASGRLGDLDGAVLGARAAAKARAGLDPVELPPGHYEVVLEPEAVADLLDNFSMFGFNGKAYAQKQSFAELEAEQFDPSVTLIDEPLGSRAEHAPGLPFDDEGTPRESLVLVRDGVTKAVAHDRSSAAEAGTTSTGHASPASRTWGPYPSHVRMEAAPAATEPADPASPVAESAQPLIARMRRGLLITDLWYTRVLDPKTLVITGLTRNGVWLVEDGEVTGAVSNMRFTQSYPQALANGQVLGIGSESILLPDRWSGTRYAAPALHLASWNLTGNASG